MSYILQHENMLHAESVQELYGASYSKTLLTMKAINLCTAFFFTVHVYCGHMMSGIEQSRTLWRDSFLDVKSKTEL